MTKDEKRTIRAELVAVVQQVFAELGGRASQEDIKAHLDTVLTAEQLRYLATPGLSSLIGATLRMAGQSGLPQAPEIDEHGTHAQLELLTIEEFAYVVRRYMERSGQNTSKAYAASRLCQEQHGVWIDPARFLADRASA